MFDIGWSELLVIVLVAVLVIGPKDIPKIMYNLGRVMRRLQYMRFAMSQQFDDILKAGDIEELRKGVNFEAKDTKAKLDPQREIHEQQADEDPAIFPLDPGDKNNKEDG